MARLVLVVVSEAETPATEVETPARLVLVSLSELEMPLTDADTLLSDESRMLEIV